MKLIFDKKIPLPEKVLMKKCGYNRILDSKSDQISYVRVFGRTHYPRFHCYVDISNNHFQINLHLDQKAPSYGTGTAHSGEYDGEVVEKEGARIKSYVDSILGIKDVHEKVEDKIDYSLMDFG